MRWQMLAEIKPWFYEPQTCTVVWVNQLLMKPGWGRTKPRCPWVRRNSTCGLQLAPAWERPPCWSALQIWLPSPHNHGNQFLDLSSPLAQAETNASTRISMAAVIDIKSRIVIKMFRYLGITGSSLKYLGGKLLPNRFLYEQQTKSHQAIGLTCVHLTWIAIIIMKCHCLWITSRPVLSSLAYLRLLNQEIRHPFDTVPSM